jgi:hypothetical protein
MSNTAEIVAEHFITAAAFTNLALDQLHEINAECWEAAVHAMAVGAPISVTTTAALNGPRRISLEMVASDGTRLTLMTLEIPASNPTTMN